MTSHLICVLLLSVQCVFGIPASSDSLDLGISGDEIYTSEQVMGSPGDVLISSNFDNPSKVDNQPSTPENSVPPPTLPNQDSVPGTASPESNSASKDGKCKYFEVCALASD